MSSSKRRRQIAWEVARLLHSREVQECFHAKQRAARKSGLRRTKPADLPSNEEVRHEIQTLTRRHDVGKGIDPYDHVAAGREALDGFISERTAEPHVGPPSSRPNHRRPRQTAVVVASLV